VFNMPEIGEGVVEGEVVAWRVALGDIITVDQPLCEIMTDKANIEIPSPKAGKIIQLHGEPGDIVQVHAPLVEIDESGTAKASAPKKAQAPKKEAKAAAAPKPAPKPAPTPAPTPAVAQPSASTGSIKASPAVRRRAREQGLDLSAIAGSGSAGHITGSDLSTAPIVPPALPQVVPSGSEERLRIIGLRRKIAQQMVKAKQTAPHFTYVEEIDATRLYELRSRLKDGAAQRGVKLTYVPLFMKALSLAFRQFPNVNAVVDEELFELVIKGDHNIGVATDTAAGLFVPVIKNVEQKSILHIAAELTQITERTRAGAASREDLTGGTFTVTSVGNIGGVFATPILNVPEVAILGINSIRDRAVVIDGEICVRKMMYLSPSFDHRVIDGAVAARFVAHLKEIIEAPEQLMWELS
jgi:pyruvate dehydrogenase E2 component (dihydrolipoamide acetyltransferase)